MKIREHWLAKQQHHFSRNNPSVKVFPYKTYYISVCVWGGGVCVCVWVCVCVGVWVDSVYFKIKI